MIQDLMAFEKSGGKPDRDLRFSVYWGVCRLTRDSRSFVAVCHG